MNNKNDYKATLDIATKHGDTEVKAIYDTMYNAMPEYMRKAIYDVETRKGAFFTGGVTKTDDDDDINNNSNS